MLHGLGDECKARSEFMEFLSNMSNTEGYCIEVGNGKWDSWFMSLEQQAEVVGDKVKAIPALSLGFHVVGLSQGNLIARAVVEYCEGVPPVKNFVSIGAPHAGTDVLPNCSSGERCNEVDEYLECGIYSSYVQDHLAPSNYVKIPTNIPGYLNGNKFLPKLNNELPNERNSTYKERFSSLQNLVLIMFENETVLVPKETSWFGFYQDGSSEQVLPPQQTKLYIEDWIGLRTLDEAGKVKYIGVSGDHLDISNTDLEKYVVPYLKDQSLTVTETEKSSSTQRSSV